MQSVTIRLDGADPSWETEMREWDRCIGDILEQAVVLRECGHRYRDTRRGLIELSVTVGDIACTARTLEERMDRYLDTRVEHEKGYPWYVG